MQLSPMITNTMGPRCRVSAACRSARNATRSSAWSGVMAPRRTTLFANTRAYSGVCNRPGMIPMLWIRISTGPTRSAKRTWDRHQMRHEVRSAGAGIGLGNRDPGVAAFSAYASLRAAGFDSRVRTA